MIQDTTQQVLTEVTTRLDAVAAKLGMAADHMWPILVRQQFYEGLVLTIAISTVAVTFLVGGIFGFKKHFEDGWWIACSVISAVLFAIAAGWSISTINPEYYAFMDLMGRF